MSRILAEADTDHPYFELAFRPSEALTSVVRRFVSEFYQNVLRDPDLAARLALATHELVENAVKYSTDGDSTLRVELDRTKGIVTVTTRNRSDPRHIDRLRARFAEMSAAKDDFSFYQTLLRRSVSETGGSGIGLARIRCEADMDLILDVGGDQVGICARTRALPGELS